MRSCQVVPSLPLIAWMLTAGRTPPTRPRLPPLLAHLAASTLTLPTDLLAFPAFFSFPLWSAVKIILYFTSFFLFTSLIVVYFLMLFHQECTSHHQKLAQYDIFDKGGKIVRHRCITGTNVT
ncbi:hypothetical protein XENOCAPTIV_001731 [Xenoophorus captivus]|uniref:Uncharacterized protein n=1 Tax=Xenoophorus captivus TaxID=1517983 RepID=A0ABV0RPN1_9TELE